MLLFITKDYMVSTNLYGLTEFGEVDNANYFISRASRKISNLITAVEFDEDTFLTNGGGLTTKQKAIVEEATAIYTDYYWKSDYDWTEGSTTTNVGGTVYSETKVYDGEKIIPNVYEMLQKYDLLDTDESFAVTVTEFDEDDSNFTPVVENPATKIIDGSTLLPSINLTKGANDPTPELVSKLWVEENGGGADVDKAYVDQQDAQLASEILQNNDDIRNLTRDFAGTTLNFDPQLDLIANGNILTATYTADTTSFDAFTNGENVTIVARDTSNNKTTNLDESWNNGSPTDNRFYDDTNVDVETTLTPDQLDPTISTLTITISGVSNQNRDNKVIEAVKLLGFASSDIVKYRTLPQPATGEELFSSSEQNELITTNIEVKDNAGNTTLRKVFLTINTKDPVKLFITGYYLKEIDAQTEEFEKVNVSGIVMNDNNVPYLVENIIIENKILQYQETMVAGGGEISTLEYNNGDILYIADSANGIFANFSTPTKLWDLKLGDNTTPIGNTFSCSLYLQGSQIAVFGITYFSETSNLNTKKIALGNTNLIAEYAVWKEV